MKRIIFTLLVAVLTFGPAYAQLSDKVRYAELKHLYNHKEYVPQAGDPYSVAWSEFISFFTPGVGQLLAGETGRGWAFMAGEAVLMGTVISAYREIEKVAITNSSGFVIGYTDEKVGKRNMAIFLGALGADLGLAIWSSIDARRIAKVKNMYYQDLIGRKAPLELGFVPTFSFSPSPDGSLQPAAGMSLQIRF